jgi:D-alanyl-D-alanine carboxypeptidase
MRRREQLFATALVFGLFTAGLIAPAWAEGVRPLTPAISAQIDELAKNEVHAGRTPGIAIGVVEDGRLAYARGFGFANLANHGRIEPDTQFYVGGLTTQFTAAAILLLAQDGKLKLDDKVTKYIPELEVAGNATVAQLLTQTSGLPDYSTLPANTFDFFRTIKLTEVFAAVNKMKPAAAPGAVYANNPLNYLAAGLIVERAGGVPLSDYLQQHIFLPLVMDGSFLAGDSGISATHAVGYARAARGFAPVQMPDPAWLGGASGLVTNVYDLAKWDIEMPILLRDDAVRTMFTPAGRIGPTQYGMGWVIDRRGGKDFVWYSGDLDGYRAINAVLPSEHVAVIVLSNADTSSEQITIPAELAGRILDLVAPPATAHLDNAVVARAREWLGRLATRQIDRTQLTPYFSDYLTDAVVAKANVAALGTLQAIVPISSTTESNGDTLYEFLVRYPRVQYHYKFAVTSDGKIDEIAIVA